jgi:hypothetical protein
MNFNDPGQKRAKRGGNAQAKNPHAGGWIGKEHDYCTCGKKKNLNDYTCSYCASKSNFQSETPTLTADKPRVSARGVSCSRCPYELRCTDRLVQNLWMMCEIPDEQDLMIRASRNGNRLRP